MEKPLEFHRNLEQGSPLEAMEVALEISKSRSKKSLILTAHHPQDPLLVQDQGQANGDHIIRLRKSTSIMELIIMVIITHNRKPIQHIKNLTITPKDTVRDPEAPLLAPLEQEKSTSFLKLIQASGNNLYISNT